VDVISETSTFSVAVVGRVVVVVASTQLTAEQVAVLGRAYERLEASGGPGDGGRFASVTLSQALKPGATDAARAALVKLSQRFKDRDVGSAVVMPAGGFQASVVRAIISGLTLLAGGNLKVFQEQDAALKWLEGLMAGKRLEGYDADAIRQALTSLARSQRPE
jgi:hypothetical protein